MPREFRQFRRRSVQRGPGTADEGRDAVERTGPGVGHTPPDIGRQVRQHIELRRKALLLPKKARPAVRFQLRKNGVDHGQEQTRRGAPHSFCQEDRWHVQRIALDKIVEHLERAAAFKTLNRFRGHSLRVETQPFQPMWRRTGGKPEHRLAGAQVQIRHPIEGPDDDAGLGPGEYLGGDYAAHARPKRRTLSRSGGTRSLFCWMGIKQAVFMKEGRRGFPAACHRSSVRSL